MNLIKQNQLFDEMFQFYCDECRKTKSDLINPKGSDTKLKTIFVGILYKDYNFSGQFLSEKFNCKPPQIHNYLAQLENAVKGNVLKETYTYARDKMKKEFNE